MSEKRAATLAGTLALVNAEILSAITIAHLVSPRIPVTYGNWARTFDLIRDNLILGASGTECSMYALDLDAFGLLYS